MHAFEVYVEKETDHQEDHENYKAQSHFSFDLTQFLRVGYLEESYYWDEKGNECKSDDRVDCEECPV